MSKVKDAAAPKAANASVVSKSEEPGADARDWSKTLFLPKTDFPMKAGLPNLEPKLLAALAGHEAVQAAPQGRQGPREVHAA